MDQRALSPATADKKLHRFAAHKLKLKEPFYFYFPYTLFGGTLLAGIGALTILLSIFYVFLALPLLAPAVWGIGYFARSMDGGTYSWNRTLYTTAYNQYKLIRDPSDRSDAMMLLQNIWAHEKAVVAGVRLHDNKYACSDCFKRGQLIEEICERQALPGTDNSDIETIQTMLQIRKELGV